MTKVIYTPAADDPQITTVNGVTFTSGVPVDVPQEWLADKLGRNPWFEIVADVPPPADTAALEDEISHLEAQLAADKAKLAH